MVMLTTWPSYCDAHIGRKLENMIILVDYLRQWHLQLSIGNTGSAPIISITVKLNWNWTCLSITNSWCFNKLQSTLACAWIGCWKSLRNNLKKWQEKSHLEYHSSVVLLVQPGEPLPEHYGSPRNPWYSPQLNIVPMSGAEAHKWRRLMSQSTSLCGPYLVVPSRILCFSSLFSGRSRGRPGGPGPPFGDTWTFKRASFE